MWQRLNLSFNPTGPVTFSSTHRGQMIAEKQATSLKLNSDTVSLQTCSSLAPLAPSFRANLISRLLGSLPNAATSCHRSPAPEREVAPCPVCRFVAGPSGHGRKICPSSEWQYGCKSKANWTLQTFDWPHLTPYQLSSTCLNLHFWPNNPVVICSL